MLEQTVMDTSSIEHFRIDTSKTPVPDRGLGEYICGFTEEHLRFKWLRLLWILIPILGLIMVLWYVIKYWWDTWHPRRAMIYKNGFVIQNLDRKGNVKNEQEVNFYMITGLMIQKTHQYRLIYGFEKYDHTDVVLSILDADGNSRVILNGYYQNKNEKSDRYNFAGYICNAIKQAWADVAINLFNREISDKGYATFHTPTDEVLVGPDFIKAGGVIVSSGFKYSFSNGFLTLYPNAAESSHFRQQADPVNISVADMYNNDVFLMAVNKFHGIK